MPLGWEVTRSVPGSGLLTCGSESTRLAEAGLLSCGSIAEPRLRIPAEAVVLGTATSNHIMAGLTRRDLTPAASPAAFRSLRTETPAAFATLDRSRYLMNVQGVLTFPRAP
jgi:hypothetical protein